jgi:hypothetical protein
MNRRKIMKFGSLALIDIDEDEDENGKYIHLPKL